MMNDKPKKPLKPSLQKLLDRLNSPTVPTPYKSNVISILHLLPKAMQPPPRTIFSGTTEEQILAQSRAESARYSSQRRAAKLKRTPAWANLEEIEAIYSESTRLTQLTGIKHNVDHIIPLQGKLVSGLHVPNNLRVITAAENNKKYNFWDDRQTV